MISLLWLHCHHLSHERIPKGLVEPPFCTHCFTVDVQSQCCWYLNFYIAPTPFAKLFSRATALFFLQTFFFCAHECFYNEGTSRPLIVFYFRGVCWSHVVHTLYTDVYHYLLYSKIVQCLPAWREWCQKITTYIIRPDDFVLFQLLNNHFVTDSPRDLTKLEGNTFSERKN